MNKGLIFDIRRFTIHDGPGIRTTVFFKGCPLNCWWCHNPESRLPYPEKSLKSIKFEEKNYDEEELTGNEMSVQEVVREVLKDRIFFEESDGGVTFSGGEPMMQFKFLLELSQALQRENIHLTLDTCGHATNGEFRQLLPFIDLFLFDLKLIDPEMHIQYTGVDNELIKNNLHLLVEKKKNVVIRFPVIPGVTDISSNIDGMKIFLAGLKPGIKEIHLLPYHSIGKSKYKRFKMENKLEDLKDLTKEDLIPIKKSIEDIGFLVRIGG